jgi:hypothetical protein
MHRCVSHFGMATAFALATFAASSFAQIQRNFPATALRGEMQLAQPPVLLLNGQQARLAPGARIRDMNNMLTMSGTLVDRRLAVHYTLDTAGLLFEVWVLTEQELANQPWPRSPEEARTWSFDATAQRWSKP